METLFGKFIRYKILRRKKPENRFFGLKRDKPDSRDRFFKPRIPIVELPESTDMQNINNFSYRYDQGILGSCVGNGVVAAFRRVLQVNNQPDHDGSRLYVYYNARDEEYKNEDAGASIRDGIKAVNAYGVCKENTWPYNINKFAIKPPDTAYVEGLEHQTLLYSRIYPVSKEAIMNAVFCHYPVIYGKKLYESYLSEDVTQTGIIPYPGRCWDAEIGSHCMVIFDYDRDYTIELNSYGVNWGMGGVAMVPWKYVLNPDLCFDFWVIYTTE